MNQQYNVPAHLLNRTTRTVNETLQNNLGKNNPPHLSIEGGRFTLVDAAGNEQPVQTYDPQLGPYIDINIIDVNDHISKVYWGADNTYNPNAQSYLPPLCFSDNGIGPSRNATEPQSPTCLQCPNGVWGSATSRITGKGIKACVDIQKLAFTVAGWNTVFVLRVPPNSLKGLGLYRAQFNGVPFDISDVWTRVSFVPGIQGTLQFQPGDYIDVAAAQLRDAALTAKAPDALIGRTDVVHPGAATLADRGPPAQLPAPQQPAGFQGYALPPQAQQPPATPQTSFQGMHQAAPSGYVQPGQPWPIQQAVQQQPSAGNASPPFVMPRQGFASTAGPSQATTAPVQNVQPTNNPAPAAPRGRGRPRTQPQQAAPVTPQQAPFPTSAPPQQQAQPVANGPGAQFGIVPGVPPNPELQAALNNALGPQ